MLKALLNYLDNKKQQENSNAELIANLVQITEENKRSLKEIQHALPALQESIEDTSSNQKIIITQLPKTKYKFKKFIDFINILMIPITLFTAYISIQTYIQVKQMEFEKLNTIWNIEKKDLFNKLRISTEEDSEEKHIPHLEIYLNLGELNYLTGEMIIIDHSKKIILYLLVKAENFQIINIVLPSKLYIWEFFNGEPNMKHFGLTIKLINEQSMEISGFNIINKEFGFTIPNTIKFTNTDNTSNITKKFTHSSTYDNYESIAIDHLCLSKNKLKPLYISSTIFNGTKNWENYCFSSI